MDEASGPDEFRINYTSCQDQLEVDAASVRVNATVDSDFVLDNCFEFSLSGDDEDCGANEKHQKLSNINEEDSLNMNADPPPDDLPQPLIPLDVPPEISGIDENCERNEQQHRELNMNEDDAQNMNDGCQREDIPPPLIPPDVPHENTLLGYSMRDLIHLLVVLATKMRHTLTYCAAEDILEVIEIISQSGDKPQTKYKFQKIINLLSTSLSIHHFCPRCNGYAGQQKGHIDEEEIPVDLLRCENCENEIEVKKNWEDGKIFIYLSLSSQLREIFERHGDSILYIKQRTKERKFALEDIYDGKMYRKNMAEDMISINFAVDGVPIFNSSNYGKHPLVCSINELAPEQRPRSMLLCGLYCGNGKLPNVNAYLTPFIRECNELFDFGFNYSYEGQLYTRKCRILCGICDSIARREVRNIRQFNGAYGCGFCKHPGKQVSKGRGTVRVYPIDEDDNAFGEGLRTHDETLIHSEVLQKGVLGRSILYDARGVDVIHGLPAEWQHNVGLGILRQFAGLWFDSENHGEEFYCGNKIGYVDNLLLSFKPSLEISRTPRRMSNRAYWKAHEWIVFLLFYSLPILKRILHKRYVDHWALLVDDISILISKSIMPSEADYANNCLHQFVKNIPMLYGIEHVSYNVHLLLHLVESVLNWGPLWTHSAFGYEDYYQRLLNFVKSSNHPALQICYSFRLQYTVHKLYDICNDELTEAQKSYLDKVLYKQISPNISLKIGSNSLLGKPITKEIQNDDFLALQRIDVNLGRHDVVRYYQRIILGREIIHSETYIRPTKRQSYYVLLKDSQIFEIRKFVVLTEENELVCYGIGYYFKKQNKSLIPNRRLSHITFLESKIDVLAAIPIDLIEEKVIFIEMKTCGFIIACRRITHCELLS